MATAEAFQELVDATRADRGEVRRLVGDGHWRQAEPDKDRLARYAAKTAAVTGSAGAEALQGDTIDFQPVSFLAEGARAQRAVGYVQVMAAGMSCSGTGFLISPQLFITNQHVVRDASVAIGTEVVFDRQADGNGRPMATTTFLLDPDRCAIFSDEGDLDFAVVALGARTSGVATPEELGFLPLANQPDRHVVGMNVNIVEHPDGAPKLVALRHNLLTARTVRTLLYETDTDHGSSGAPVLNDLWEVVALHHYGEPFLERVDDQGRSIPATVNEGVRISAIYDDLSARTTTLDADARALVEQSLAYAKATQTVSGDRTLGPPRPSVAIATGSREEAMMTQAPDDGITLTVPLEVTVRVGNAGAHAGSILTSPPQVRPAVASESRSLTPGAEKVRVDADYSDRKGYDAAFIPDVEIAMPTPGEELAKQIGALRAGETNPERGILNYEHFSLVLNKAKRVAMFTATNIDGETYLDIDRTTGRVKDAAEGEVWFNDPRVSASFYLDQTFYSAWSQYFDRGHLTRRSDPTWGTAEEAERANADTYHFTNCSPQHFLFNQSTDYWQGAERYVLEKGVLARESRRRLSVFQGPIYSDAIDHWADDVQVPSSFFKIVVWRGEEGLKAVGLVVDQLALLDRKRTGQRPPSDGAVQVNQWRVPVADIAKRTGLVFPHALVEADTIRQPGQPAVGEAGLLLRSMADLLS